MKLCTIDIWTLVVKSKENVAVCTSLIAALRRNAGEGKREVSRSMLRSESTCSLLPLGEGKDEGRVDFALVARLIP